MEMIMESIKRAVGKVFKEHDLDINDFEHDITCFNETGIRCAVVYDNPTGAETTIVVIGLRPNLKGEWLEDFFKRCDGDGVLAMCEADAFLRDHD